QLYQLVQDCQVATSISEEPDLGAIWIDPGNRSLVIERHQLVQGMEVIDLQGRAVLPTQRPTGRTTDLSALPSGVYLFRMWSEGGVVVRRMFLE
ncbi:MAG: T9SS type A sorting domain-containing protein, partial [Flavobacteriales bacterium]|nr:T9SS type A sorting domain-containing protein [Flavobacteriales bacterium]